VTGDGSSAKPDLTIRRIASKNPTTFGLGLREFPAEQPRTRPRISGEFKWMDFESESIYNESKTAVPCFNP